MHETIDENGARQRLAWRTLTIAAALTFAVATAQAQQAFKTDAELVKAVLPSVVNIYQRHAEVPQTMVDGRMETTGPQVIHDEVGSGFIVDPSGLIVTNRHVIEGAYALFVTLSDGTHVPARLIGKALTFDIAVIKIDIDKPLPPVKIGDSDKMQVGDRVVAIGNPLGFANSVSAGIISAFHRSVGLSAYDDLMQTDATINQGNSGGPLFNTSGEVIGINQAIYTRNQGGSIGIGFSIPVNEAKYLLDNVKAFGDPRIGWLGVTAQTFTSGMASALGAPESGGAIVSVVMPNTPAEKSGMQVGDTILAVGDRKIFNVADLNRAIAIKPGQTVALRIFRNGATMTLSPKVEQWPQDLWSTAMPAAPLLKDPSDFGITFSRAASTEGLVVAEVAEKSIAWSAGMRAGDVILRVQSTDMRSETDLMNVVHRLTELGKQTAVVLLGGPNGTRWVEFSVQE